MSRFFIFTLKTNIVDICRFNHSSHFDLNFPNVSLELDKIQKICLVPFIDLSLWSRFARDQTQANGSVFVSECFIKGLFFLLNFTYLLKTAKVKILKHILPRCRLKVRSHRV